MTLGEEGSGFSKAQPFFFPGVEKNGDAPPLRLPFLRSFRLSELERETGASRAARPGLRIDLDSFMEEEEERREAKQIKISLVLAVVLPAGLQWGLSKSILIWTVFLLNREDFFSHGWMNRAVKV